MPLNGACVVKSRWILGSLVVLSTATCVFLALFAIWNHSAIRPAESAADLASSDPAMSAATIESVADLTSTPGCGQFLVIMTDASALPLVASHITAWVAADTAHGVRVDVLIANATHGAAIAAQCRALLQLQMRHWLKVRVFAIGDEDASLAEGFGESVAHAHLLSDSFSPVADEAHLAAQVTRFDLAHKYGAVLATTPDLVVLLHETVATAQKKWLPRLALLAGHRLAQREMRRVYADLQQRYNTTVVAVAPAPGAPFRVVASAALGDGAYLMPCPVVFAVATQRLHFFMPILRLLASEASVAVYVDHWATHRVHDHQRAKHVRGGADVVWLEWALANAVYYSQPWRSVETARPQQLVIRLHRMELFKQEYMEGIHWARVSDLVFIAPAMRDQFVRSPPTAFAGASTRLHVIPNAFNTARFAGPKPPGALKVVGMLKYTPSRKRPDRAMDLYELLRPHGFVFRILDKNPEDYNWLWRDGVQRQYYESLHARIAALPAGAVLVTNYTETPEDWLQEVGWVLSPSDHEGSHQAVAEGMAAGAVPIVWPWEGAAELYPQAWICDNTTAMARRILRAVEDESARTSTLTMGNRSAAAPGGLDTQPTLRSEWESVSRAARDEATARFDSRVVFQRIGDKLFSFLQDTTRRRQHL